ncbi:MAG: trypsin-like peptidase domain-containing protein [Pirellulales bacterium]
MDVFSQPPQPQSPAPRTLSRLPWLVVLLAVLVGFLLLPRMVERIVYAVIRGRERAEVDVAREQLPTPELTQISHQFALVAKAIGPSVVHIDTVQVVDGPGNYRGLRNLGQYEALGQGSGVIIDEAGYVLTNSHVVENARQINVTLSGNETRPAEIVGLDETTDLALLQIASGGLIAAQWGDSDALKVGSPVWAVGNPFGLDRSVTFGIISAKNRHGFRGASPYQDFLQTDAAVNPGNSGGPLVDETGKIVGINTAIIGRGYQGVSFSIPTSIAKEVYGRLRESGKVVRGYMGVELQDLTVERAQELALKEIEGAVVMRVSPAGPAAKAGIRVDDVIVAWDGQTVGDATELTLLVGKTKVGSQVNVIVMRDGQKMELKIAVEERPPPGKR